MKSNSTVRVPRIDGIPGTEEFPIVIDSCETVKHRAFGVGCYTTRHVKVYVDSDIPIGKVQYTTHKGRTPVISVLDEYNVCVTGNDIPWIVREWRERKLGKDLRINRIKPGASYIVPQDFGIGPAAVTALGRGYVPKDTMIKVTQVNSDTVEFEWTRFPSRGISEANQSDSLVRSSFESLVESFTIRESQS